MVVLAFDLVAPAATVVVAAADSAAAPIATRNEYTRPQNAETQTKAKQTQALTGISSKYITVYSYLNMLITGGSKNLHGNDRRWG